MTNKKTSDIEHSPAQPLKDSCNDFLENKPNSHSALKLHGVRLVRNNNVILEEINWTIGQNESWVILGKNGSGKTSLLQIASLYTHPTAGTVDVLGNRLGRTDVRALRTRIGLCSSALEKLLREDLRAIDVVMTAKNAALSPHWHVYDSEDHRKADALLDKLHCSELASRMFGTLSSGERQRVQIARALMTDPKLLLLDEPTSTLDLNGREKLFKSLAKLTSGPTSPATVLTTHHVEQIPPSFTHVLLLIDGHIFTAGKLEDVLTSKALSTCFGLPLHLERRNNRWTAWAK